MRPNTRRAAVGLSIVLALAASGTILFGFASYSTIAETHQYILREAFKLLENDQAFRATEFPTLAAILQFEGVYYQEQIEKPALIFNEGEPTEISLKAWSHPLSGNGMDNKAPYSWHYYNPTTKEGLAPKKAADYFDVLRRARLDLLLRNAPNVEVPPGQAAAWVAHIVADLNSPYHVNGTDPGTLPVTVRTDTIRVTTAAGEQRDITRVQFPTSLPLSDDIVGPGGAGLDWAASYRLFHDEKPRPDWFDPWYWNGHSLATGTHGWSELVAAAATSAHQLTGYSPLLVASLQSTRHVDGPTLAQFARDRATATDATSSTLKIRVARLWSSTVTHTGVSVVLHVAGVLVPVVSLAKLAYESRRFAAEANEMFAGPLDQAIQDVYSVWRASLCALRPDVDLIADPAAGPGSGTLIITVNNVETREAAGDVSIEVEAQGGLLVGPRTFTLPGSIPAQGRTDVRDVWTIQGVGKAVRVTVRVKGAYRQVPDAGETALVKDVTMTPAPPALPTPPAAGGKLEDAVKAALRTLGYQWKPMEMRGNEPVEPTAAGAYLRCASGEQLGLVSARCIFVFLAAPREQVLTDSSGRPKGRSTEDGVGFDVRLSAVTEADVLHQFRLLTTEPEMQAAIEGGDVAQAWGSAYQKANPGKELSRAEALALITGDKGPLRRYRGLLGYSMATDNPEPWSWKSSRVLKFLAVDPAAAALIGNPAAFTQTTDLVKQLNEKAITFDAFRQASATWPPFGFQLSVTVTRSASCSDAALIDWINRQPSPYIDSAIAAKTICPAFKTMSEPTREINAIVDELFKAGLVSALPPGIKAP